MRIISQDALSEAEIISECEEYRTSGRKNFVSAGYKRRFAGLVPAWNYEGEAFQLTLHTAASQGSPVMGFASGRIRRVYEVEAAIVELVAVLPEARGKRFGIAMHDFVMKHTGLPLAAAHTQTPQGRDLWLRMLTHGKQMLLTVLSEHGRHRVKTEEDILHLPFDMFDGSDATFLLAKNHYEKFAVKENLDDSPSLRVLHKR